MARQILYRNHCTPQEQVSSGGRYYLDSDCGRKLTGSYLLELDEDKVLYNTITGNAETIDVLDPGDGGAGTAGDSDFLYVKAIKIYSGTVKISLDNGSTTPIELYEGEAFASKINASASVQPKIVVSGLATVEYLVAT
jgi:hypothetical protein